MSRDVLAGKGAAGNRVCRQCFQEIKDGEVLESIWSSEPETGNLSAVQVDKSREIYCSFLATLVAATLAAAVLVFLYVRW